MQNKPIVPNNPAPGNPAPPKIGDGHANAMFRQGLSELRSSLYTGSNIAQPAEYGLYGHQTPGEIADDRKPEKTVHQSLDEEPTQATSPLQQSMREADARAQSPVPDRTRDRNQDRDR